MKNHVIILLLFSAFTFGCEDRFVQNHFTINSFTITCVDNVKKAVLVKFDITYYSDSTQKNYYANSMQKGLSGSDYEILFWGYKNSTKEKVDSTNYETETFNSFKNRYNKMENMYIGEVMLNREIIIQTDWDCQENKNNIILVRKDKTSQVIDTLYANIK